MMDSYAPNPFTIRSHRLFRDGHPVPFLWSPNQSSDFTPRGIIIHDTAGRLERGDAFSWFLRGDAKASAHVTIERDGSVSQLVGFERRAWHAGKSRYRGESDVNGFAFGIEMVNIGKCAKVRDGHFQPWFKDLYREISNDLRFAFAQTKNHGKGWWLDYTPAQMQTVRALCQALTDKYELSFIAGHWEISPGRKIDPNPLFPLEALRTSLFGEVGEGEGPILVADANLRRWPSYHDNIIKVLTKGDAIEIIRSGTYNPLGQPEIWHLVDAGGQQGWLHGSLVEIC